MSREKVNKYKQEKTNRQAIIKKEKIKTRVSVTVVVAAIAALAVWFCASAIMKANYVTPYYEADYTAIDDFIVDMGQG